jgi:hypothetical protein
MKKRQRYNLCGDAMQSSSKCVGYLDLSYFNVIRLVLVHESRPSREHT